MSDRLLPLHLVEDSLEFHLARHGRTGHLIYRTLVGLTVAALAALPLLHVDVAVQSGGIVRPRTEKHDVRPQLAGVVDAVFVREGQAVERGTPLVRLRAAAVDERAALIADQLADKRRQVADLQWLVAAQDLPASPPPLATGEARQDYAQVADEVRAARTKELRAQREMERTRQLQALHFATAQELEDREYQAVAARAERTTLGERARARWQTQLAAQRQELRELESRRAQADEERSLYTVRAPVAGTVEELTAISAGSFVQPSDRLAVISPSAGLVAEVYVAPSDVGLLRVGAPVRVSVDAFNPSDWGDVPATVSSISGDFVDVGGHPMFKVQCAMRRSRLTLRSGAVGVLRKGMTLRARFVVARRSLLQLLRDDVSNWLDPARAPLTAGAGA
jgi:HlyD family secretion protein